MPGLCGIFGFGRPEEKAASLRQMVECMLHEPFYSSGTYVNEQKGFWIGWVNHSNSFSDCMPIWNEKKDVCIFFSGEDYTDVDKIFPLRSKGHDFKPGDASYLVHGYEESGADFIGKLNGRFNGIVIDLRDNRALLFNDRYGLNRIYYCENKDGYYFSSEAKSLLRVLPELRSLDLKSLGETFALGCVLQNRTLFPGISLVPGGSAWTFFPGQNAKKTLYFQPTVWEERQRLSAGEYSERLRETWKRVLPRYLRGKEQIALSLTGGKDSRMILAWAQSPPGSLPCYTFGGLYRESMDIKLAREIAGICHQTFQPIIVDKSFLEEFPGLAERTVYLTDGIMDVSGATELYINRIARHIAPVRLTGNYAQEILRSSIAFKPMPFQRRVLRTEFSEIIDSAIDTYRHERQGHPLSFVAFKQVPWHHYSRLSLELSQLTLRSPFLDNELVALSYQAPSDPAINLDIQLKLITEADPVLSKIGTDRGILYQPSPVITKARHLFQEFTAKAEYAYDYGMPQWLSKLDYGIKKLHAERLFLGRHKFAHYRVWYRDQLSGYVKAVLLDPRTRSRPYLNGPRLEEMVRSHIKGTGNFTLEIHRLLTTELIQRQFID